MSRASSDNLAVAREERLFGQLLARRLCSRPLTEVVTFLRAEGTGCRDISLAGNDVHRVETAFATAEGAANEAVKISGFPPAG